MVAKHQQNRFTDDHGDDDDGGGGDDGYDLILILMLSSDYWKELFNFQMSSCQNKTFHHRL